MILLDNSWNIPWLFAVNLPTVRCQPSSSSLSTFLQFAVNLPPVRCQPSSSSLSTILQFAVNLPSGRMSPPTERDLSLPSLLPAHPPQRGVTGCRAACQRNPTGPPGIQGRSRAGAHPSPHLPTSPPHRADGAQHRLAGESLTHLSTVPASPPSPCLSASPSRVAGGQSRRDGCQPVTHTASHQLATHTAYLPATWPTRG